MRSLSIVAILVSLNFVCGCGGSPNSNADYYDGSISRSIRQSEAEYSNAFGKGAIIPVY